jgi:hypothetical protein
LKSCLSFVSAEGCDLDSYTTSIQYTEVGKTDEHYHQCYPFGDGSKYAFLTSANIDFEALTPRCVDGTNTNSSIAAFVQANLTEFAQGSILSAEYFKTLNILKVNAAMDCTAPYLCEAVAVDKNGKNMIFFNTGRQVWNTDDITSILSTFLIEANEKCQVEGKFRAWFKARCRDDMVGCVAPKRDMFPLDLEIKTKECTHQRLVAEMSPKLNFFNEGKATNIVFYGAYTDAEAYLESQFTCVRWFRLKDVYKCPAARSLTHCKNNGEKDYLMENGVVNKFNNQSAIIDIKHEYNVEKRSVVATFKIFQPYEENLKRRAVRYVLTMQDIAHGPCGVRRRLNPSLTNPIKTATALVNVADTKDMVVVDSSVIIDVTPLRLVTRTITQAPLTTTNTTEAKTNASSLPPVATTGEPVTTTATPFVTTRFATTTLAIEEEPEVKPGHGFTLLLVFLVVIILAVIAAIKCRLRKNSVSQKKAAQEVSKTSDVVDKEMVRV